MDAWRRRDGRFSTSKSPEAVAHGHRSDGDKRGSLTFTKEPLLEANYESRRSGVGYAWNLSITGNEREATVDFTFNKD